MSARTVIHWACICCVVIVLTERDALCQSGGDYSIDWSTIGDGGGGVLAAGDFSLHGTVGQPDAGSQLSTGQPFGHRNGYWVFSDGAGGDIYIYCYKDGGDVRIEWVPLEKFTHYDIYYGHDRIRKDFFILEQHVAPPYLHIIDPADDADYYYNVEPVPWKGENEQHN